MNLFVGCPKTRTLPVQLSVLKAHIATIRTSTLRATRWRRRARRALTRTDNDTLIFFLVY